jgi:hypothetical protein
VRAAVVAVVDSVAGAVVAVVDSVAGEVVTVDAVEGAVELLGATAVLVVSVSSPQAVRVERSRATQSIKMIMLRNLFILLPHKRRLCTTYGLG